MSDFAAGPEGRGAQGGSTEGLVHKLNGEGQRGSTEGLVHRLWERGRRGSAKGVSVSPEWMMASLASP